MSDDELEKPKRNYHVSRKVQEQRKTYRQIRRKKEQLEKLETKKSKLSKTPKLHEKKKYYTVVRQVVGNPTQCLWTFYATPLTVTIEHYYYEEPYQN